MKIKEAYTLEELCTGLTIPLVKFCQMAGITEATLIRLRKGYAGRQHTINSILATFSKVYGMEFSLENVTGLTVQEQPHQKGKKPRISTLPTPAIPTTEAPQKRKYKPRDTALPEGCILASEFAESHGVNRRTFIDHMDRGLGPGLIGTSTDTIPERDHVDYSERDHPSRKGEKERYLTQEQQAAALDFWRRHGVEFRMLDGKD